MTSGTMIGGAGFQNPVYFSVASELSCRARFRFAATVATCRSGRSGNFSKWNFGWPHSQRIVRIAIFFPPPFRPKHKVSAANRILKSEQCRVLWRVTSAKRRRVKAFPPPFENLGFTPPRFSQAILHHQILRHTPNHETQGSIPQSIPSYRLFSFPIMKEKKPSDERCRT